jgi:hypothetical protein
VENLENIETKKRTLNWEIRLIDPAEHIETLYGLFCEIFKEKVTRKQFIWKYQDNPLGPMKVWSAWDLDRKKMIAAFSAYERQLIYQGKLVTVYQQADAMVRAECRGHGVFTKLLKAMSDNLRQNGVLFTFGYTNHKSAPILRKYDFSRETYLSTVMVYINGFRTASETLFKKNSILSNIVSVGATPFIKSLNKMRGHARAGPIFIEPLDDFKRLPEEWSFEVAAFHHYFPYRSREFLRWRALEAPEILKKDLYNFWCLRNGKKIGYFTLYRHTKRNVLKIIDHLCTKPEKNMVDCFCAVRRLAIQEGYDAVTTNVASRLYQKALEHAGFFKNKPVRCTIIFLQPELMPEQELPENFWMQLPIDRDVIDY